MARLLIEKKNYLGTLPHPHSPAGCAIRRVQYKVSPAEQWIKRRGTATVATPDAPGT